MNLAPADDPVVAIDDARTTGEDTPVSLDVRTNDTDPDNDPLTVSNINGTAVTTGSPVAVTDGTVTRQPDGTLVFQPAANFDGTASFNYTVADGNGSTSSATVIITVNPTNDQPIAVNDSASTPEDTAIAISVVGNDSDPDGDTLAVAEVDGATISVGVPVAVADGTVTLLPDGRLNFAPATNFNGITSFTYQVTDGNGGVSVATVQVTVAAVNDTPVADDDSASTAEDTPVNLAILGNDTDPDGDGLSVVSIDGVSASTGIPVAVADGSLTLRADGSVDFDPAPNFNGTTSFNYTIGDGNGGSDSALVTIDISAINDQPVAANDSYTTNEDTPVTFEARSNDGDVDGHPLVVSLIDGQPISVGSPVAVANGTVSVNASGLLTFSPSANFNGSTSFSYTVDDGNGGTDTASIDVTVNGLDDAPVATNDTDTTLVDTPVIIDVLANDSDGDGDALSVANINGTPTTVGVPVTVANGSVTLQADGRLRFAPDAGYTGAVQFDYSVQDPGGLNDTATVDVTITPANASPVAVNDTYTVTEEGSVNLVPLSNDSDPEGDAITLDTINGVAVVNNSTIGVPNGLVRVAANGELTFEPAANFSGTTGFGYTVRDSAGNTAAAVITIDVTPTGDAPVLQDDSAITNEDTPVNITVLSNDTDPDGESLAVTSVNGQPIVAGDTVDTANGRVIVLADGSLTFAPAPDFNGQAQFTYEATDTSGQTAQASVTVDVQPVNDAPAARDDNLIGVIGQPLLIDPVGNDIDPDADGLVVREVAGQPITVGQPVTLPEGTVRLLPDGRLEFVPVDDTIESVRFTYTVSDNNGETAQATVDIRLQDVTVITAPPGRDEFERSDLSPSLERAGEYDPIFISPAVRSSQSDTGYADLRSLSDIESTTTDRFAWNHSQASIAVPSLLAMADQQSGDGPQFGWVRSDDPLMLGASDVFCQRVDHNDNLQCWDDELPDSVRNLQYVLIDAPLPAVADPGDQTPDRKKPGLVKRSDVLPLPPTDRTPQRFAPFSNQVNREADSVGPDRAGATAETAPLI